LLGSKKRFYLLTGGNAALLTVDLRPTVVTSTRLDMASGETAGGFSLASRVAGSDLVLVAVGGDYKGPDQTRGTATYRIDGRWRVPDTPPTGYRSAVEYYAPGKTWIAVGPNGTDISIDDGRNWRALKPAAGEAPDANKNWNALALPFVGGPNGRIGKLNPGASKR